MLKGFMLTIKTKIVIYLILISSVIMGGITWVYIYNNNEYFDDEVKNKLERDLQGFSSVIEDYKERAFALSNSISLNPDVVKGVQEKDFEKLKKVLGSLMEKSDLDYAVITDDQGYVIIRGHEPNEIPEVDDNVLNQINIQEALKGNNFVGIEEGKVVKLSIRAGSPIYDEDKRVIGAISSGYVISQNKIVNKAKEVFDGEFCLLYKEELVATSFQDYAGKSLDEIFLITDEISEAFQGGLNTYKNKVGKTNYITGFKSITGADDKPIGFIGCSISLDRIETLKATTYKRAGVLLIVALVLIIFFVNSFANQIADTFAILKEQMYVVGKGDFTSKCDVDSTDEMGDICSSFNVMVSHQSNLISKVKETVNILTQTSDELATISEQVTGAVEEIAQSMDRLAHEAQDGNNAVAESVSLFENLSSLIEKSKKLAALSEGSSKTTLEVAEDGRNTIQISMKNMVNIAKKTSYMEDTVEEFTKYLDEITNISVTINQIADQTNLLALNASIEAARSGEAGKGFEVVAQEIRKLAEQSDIEAKKVGNIVAKIEQIFEILIRASKESHDEVKNGISISDKAVKALGEIINAVKDTVLDIEKIQKINDEQVASSDRLFQLTKAVVSIVDSTTSHAEEVSAGSEEITASMEDVKEATINARQIAEDLDIMVAPLKVIDKKNMSDKDLLEKAKTDHLMWKIRVENMIAGNESIDIADITSHKNCDLGKWYFDTNNFCKDEKEYVTLDMPHKQVHQCALEAVKAYQKGNSKIAKKYLKSLKYNSGLVIKKLNSLIRKIED